MQLLSPTDLCQLIVPRGDSLFVAKSDVRNMYHMFRVPTWMSEFFGLPSIRASHLQLSDFHFADNTVIVWPLLLTLPMGFSHAVFLAHSIHMHIVTNAIPKSVSLVSPSTPPLSNSSSAFFSYIDDHGFFSTSCEQSNHFLHLSVAALDKSGLFHHQGKHLPAAEATTSTEVLGLSVSKVSLISPEVSRLDMISHWTRHFLNSVGDPIPTSFYFRVVGSWVWIVLIVRPLLSVMDHIFRLDTSSATVVLPPDVLHEFSLLLDLLPLCVFDLTRPVANIMIATDACLSGGAVMFSTLSDADGILLKSHSYIRGWYSSLLDDLPCPPLFYPPSVSRVVNDGDWKLAIQTQWKFRDPIVLLEGHAFLLALRWLSRQPQYFHSRIPFFLDSASLLGALAKGRSSSYRLNSVCKRSAALLLATDISPIYLWIPSQNNPADGPSRFFEQ